MRKGRRNTELSSILCAVSYLQGGNRCKRFLAYFPVPTGLQLSLSSPYKDQTAIFTNFVAFSISSI